MSRSFLTPVHDMLNSVGETSVNTTPPGVDRGYINKGYKWAGPQPKTPPPTQQLGVAPPAPQQQEGGFDMQGFMQGLLASLQQNQQPQPEVPQEELQDAPQVPGKKVPKPPIPLGPQMGSNGQAQLFDPSKPETYNNFSNQSAMGSAAGVGGMSAAGFGMSASGIPNGIAWDKLAGAMANSGSGGQPQQDQPQQGNVPPPPQLDPNARQGTHYNSSYSNGSTHGYQQPGGYFNTSQLQRQNGYLPGSSLKS